MAQALNAGMPTPFEASHYIDLPESLEDSFGYCADRYVRVILSKRDPLGAYSRADYEESVIQVEMCRIAPYSPIQKRYACKSQIMRRNTAAAERAIRLAIVNNNA